MKATITPGGPKSVTGENPNVVALYSEASQTARDIVALLTSSIDMEAVGPRPKTEAVVVPAMEAAAGSGDDGETPKHSWTY